MKTSKLVALVVVCALVAFAAWQVIAYAAADETNVPAPPAVTIDDGAAFHDPAGGTP